MLLIYAVRIEYNQPLKIKKMARDNPTWIADLTSIGQRRESALADLREIVRNGLPYALSRWLSPADPGFESLIEEATQETLMRVLEKLDTFRGQSKFTTWVYKIAVRIALSDLRRHRWRDVSLDELVEKPESLSISGLMSGKEPDPELTTEKRDLMEVILKIIQQELTEKQNQAIIAITMHGIPLDELANKMNMERNALYKLIHDARIRLKNRLAEQGLTPAEILATFE
ncbi:MAG: hypothetical protein A2Z16_09480 [Chloroflexi bacterium RBG_16_54_18]|nr:MAG: hypothetical protein A2Z16_09480 [Chloroflexi bacterium RBG_16_54_18]